MMTPKEVIEYWEKTLTNEEIKKVAITCPNCRNAGHIDGQVCPICKGNRLLKPRNFIKEHKGGE